MPSKSNRSPAEKVLFFLLVVAIAIGYTFTAAAVWNWYVAPITHFAQLTYWPACGIMLFPFLLQSPGVDKKTESDEPDSLRYTKHRLGQLSGVWIMIGLLHLLGY